MTARTNPNVDGRVTLNRLWLLMMEEGIDRVNVNGVIIPSITSADDDYLYTVQHKKSGKKERWTSPAIKRHLAAYKAHYGAAFVWDPNWGLYTLRKKAKPPPKKRGPKPKEPEKRPVGRPKQERFGSL